MAGKVRFIVPAVCKQCGFAIQPRQQFCTDCKKENKAIKKMQDRYERDFDLTQARRHH